MNISGHEAVGWLQCSIKEHQQQIVMLVCNRLFRTVIISCNGTLLLCDATAGSSLPAMC